MTFSVQFFSRDGERMLPVSSEKVPNEPLRVKYEGRMIPVLFACEDENNRPNEIERLRFEVAENFPMSIVLTNLSDDRLEMIVNIFYICRKVLSLKPKETITIDTMKNHFIVNPPEIPIVFSPTLESDWISIEGKTYASSDTCPIFTYAKADAQPVKCHAEEKRCVFSMKSET